MAAIKCEVGVQLEVELDGGTWYPATVAEVGEQRIRIHITGWGDNTDKWEPARSKRLRLAGATRGLSLRNIIASGRRRYANLVLSNWRFWVPVEMLFFALLPPELLVPATCLAALCWNMILSTLSFRSRGERPAVTLIS